jgi:hypothetical protein
MSKRLSNFILFAMIVAALPAIIGVSILNEMEKQ